MLLSFVASAVESNGESGRGRVSGFRHERKESRILCVLCELCGKQVGAIDYRLFASTEKAFYHGEHGGPRGCFSLLLSLLFFVVVVRCCFSLLFIVFFPLFVGCCFCSLPWSLLFPLCALWPLW